MYFYLIETMTHWTTEEDNTILCRLEDEAESYNYDLEREKHNARFKTSRTELAYKARVKKIAKDNNISLGRANGWTDKEKEEIIEMIKKNPMDTDWKSLTEKYNCVESTLKLLYNTSVTPMENVEYCMKAFQSENLLEKILSQKQFECSSCHRIQYHQPKKWGSDVFCDECHLTTLKDEIDMRWKQVREYATATKKINCKICDCRVSYNKDTGSRFHFDHINMFEKGDSIYSMVMNGTPIEEIYHEMDLCQAMCISCHAIVTEIERKCGFMRMKNNMTRDMKKDETQTDDENKQKYDMMMKPMYEYLRERLKVVHS
jgi:hypothetical protein